MSNLAASPLVYCKITVRPRLRHQARPLVGSISAAGRLTSRAPKMASNTNGSAYDDHRGYNDDEEVPRKRPRRDENDEKDGDPDDPYKVDDYVPYVSLKQRKQEQFSKIQKHLARPLTKEEPEERTEEEIATAGPRANVSLIDQAVEIKKKEAGE